MRILVSIFLAFTLLAGAYAQEGQLSKSELKKLQKEQKKAEAEAQRELAARATAYMVNSHKFVLEADYISDKTGQRFPVQSMINFILLDSLTGTLQLGSASTVGVNGVGGATIDGRITNYKATEVGKKKDSWSVSVNFSSSLGSYDITLMIGTDGYTDATVRGNWGDPLSYHGKIIPLEQSRIYKGHTTF